MLKNNILLIILFSSILFFGCVGNNHKIATGKSVVVGPELWNTTSYKTYSDEQMILTKKVGITFEDYSIYTVGDCGSFENDTKKDDCFIACGVKLNNSEVCSFTSLPDDCYYKIATADNNIDSCSKINNTTVKNKCYLYNGVYFGNINACDLYSAGSSNNDNIEKCYISVYEKENFSDCENKNIHKFKEWCATNKTINLSLFNTTRGLFLSNMTECFVWTVLNLSEQEQEGYNIGIQKNYSMLAEYYNVPYVAFDGVVEPNNIRSFMRNNKIDYMILDRIPEWLINPETETGLFEVYSDNGCVVVNVKMINSSPKNVLTS
ncbi:hypothetical protein J7J90_01250 [Candidatus Micrarchaeota archaeon]|nr:hypothetical protein [Candidatus Micrarchaeota archaeon]